ncbi:hypothetical protein AJ80_05821 [Polytolypa hystricis UAMH7299]|uniref:Glycosyl transferase CAP10 domain-containing protein n=1 Tax=Polytolypa hystricis (strain UAMH7299) TaxID=1447883 RepID=A0A2B7Y0T0_POLH7|nr:hypothetical protein AJ80_05821 [Polytolypa hystricis UAMH7299]
MALFHTPSRRPRLCLHIFPPCLLFLAGLSIYLLWFGMNSDLDNVHPLLTQLIPAGHCACKYSTTFNCTSSLAAVATTSPQEPPEQDGKKKTWSFQYPRDASSIHLSPAQCQTSFPGLFTDIHRAVDFWSQQATTTTTTTTTTHNNNNLTRSTLDAIPLKPGMARARLHNGHLSILATSAAQEDHRRKILAILSAMHRALPSTEDLGPGDSMEFVFSVEDKVEDINSGNGGSGKQQLPVWVLARKASEEDVWLIPDFGFWSWENEKNMIGPYDDVVAGIEEDEREEKRRSRRSGEAVLIGDGQEEEEEGDWWAKKVPKLVWRGKLSFAPKLRRMLLEAARGNEWGDVKELVWSKKENFISMQDHCKYAFVAHVEGRAYSSSLKYRQACRSVIIAHKLQYIQHHHYLLQSSGAQQNFVEVERDFSDLQPKIEALIADPEKARSIADNSVRVFRERYLTKAAEACYWRELWRGWGKVYSDDEGDEGVGRKGMRYESFVLLESEKMMRFEAQS